jgi:D-alanyl-D-alanine carboxypeptidase/D-alanyl-D-alanine-endopeptidase (penicillin-binding protein 4)
MRAFLATVATTGALVAGAAAAPSAWASHPSHAAVTSQASHRVTRAAASRWAHASQATAAAQRTLGTALSQGLGAVGGASGAYVVDMTTGQPLFSFAATTGRMPASVEKVYTTSTALLRLGPNSNLTTAVLGKGWLGRYGGWHGTLYLKGGGDPTFGTTSFDQYAYGAGATIQRLVRNLRAAGITSVHGRIVGDESYFDSLRGTPPYGYQFSPDVEGSLSALVFNRGLVNQGSAYVIHPALYATQQLELALRAGGIRVPRRTPIAAGAAPAGAKQLATVHSPPIATLVQLTNTPSDNFVAEMLLKGLGARFGGRGTTAAGAAVVRDELASSFGIHPQLEDGSGLSRNDSTSPLDVVTVLEQMATNSYFTNSLAVAGETGTLQNEMVGTVAQGRCRGKTGTLNDVANLAGYCQAQDGHTLVFAFLMSSVDPSFGHSTEAQMAVALAGYNG